MVEPSSQISLTFVREKLEAHLDSGENIPALGGGRARVMSRIGEGVKMLFKPSGGGVTDTEVYYFSPSFEFQSALVSGKDVVNPGDRRFPAFQQKAGQILASL